LKGRSWFGGNRTIPLSDSKLLVATRGLSPATRAARTLVS
jgi:hypothetical protein